MITYNNFRIRLVAIICRVAGCKCRDHACLRWCKTDFPNADDSAPLLIRTKLQYFVLYGQPPGSTASSLRSSIFHRLLSAKWLFFFTIYLRLYIGVMLPVPYWLRKVVVVNISTLWLTHVISQDVEQCLCDQGSNHTCGFDQGTLVSHQRK